MESNVALAQASTEEIVLPERVQEALGQLVGSAKEGLLALSVGVGLGVLAELLEEEVVEVVGAKGKHDPDRVAVRHGHESGEVTLGGRRVAVERPRVRSADGSARWRQGDMRQRWTAAGMLEAEHHFRRVKGYRDLPKLTAAIQRELQPTTPTEETATLIAA